MKNRKYIYVGLLAIALTGFLYKTKVINISPLADPKVSRVVSLMEKLKTNLPDNVKIPIAIAIASNGSKFDIPAEKLVAVAYKESKFDPNAVNRSGDRGVMQVNRFWGKPYYEREEDLFNPYKCVETACKMIKANELKGKGIEFYHSWDFRDRLSYKKDLTNILRRLEDV